MNTLTPQSSPTNFASPKKKALPMGACSHYDTKLPGNVDLASSVSKEATGTANCQDAGHGSAFNNGARRTSIIRSIIPEESYEVNWILNIFDPNVTSMNDVIFEENRI